MTPHARLSALAVLGVAGLVLAGCSSAEPDMDGGPEPAATTPEDSAQAESSPENLAVETAPVGSPVPVTTGLAAPWSITFLDDTALISERDTGAVLELMDDGSTRVVGTVEGVHATGEAGLLGITVDDDGRLYTYSTGAHENRIHRFVLTGEPGSLGLGPAEPILTGIPAGRIHSGGRIAIGPDQMLYATVGDVGQPDSAQDLDDLAGTILRMTPDGGIPDDNPFPGSLVYSYGHRNPQGIAWAEDGTMFSSEFGADTWDELNIIIAGGNYGWPEVEGVGGGDQYIDPVQQWRPAEASPSGIAIVDGTVFIANLRGQVLRAVPVDEPTSSTEHLVGEVGRLRDVAVSPDGELWVVTNNTDGRGNPGPDDDRLLEVRLP